MIENSKINIFLDSWRDGIIKIGKVYLQNGNYKKSAEKFIETHYAFDTESVLFKPTFTKEVIFRNSKEYISEFVITDEKNIKWKNFFSKFPYQG